MLSHDYAVSTVAAHSWWHQAEEEGGRGVNDAAAYRQPQRCVVDHNFLYFPNDPRIWIELYKINMDVMEFLFDAVFCIIKQNIVTF